MFDIVDTNKGLNIIAKKYFKNILKIKYDL